MEEICMSFRPTKKNFIEFNQEGKDSLQRWHDVFVEICDPTEYKAAIELAGSWTEWERYKREWPYFSNNILPDWLTEVEIKIRSDAVKHLVRKAKDDSSAAKFLAKGEYKDKQTGRPSKKEQEREQAVRKKVRQDTDPDVERVLNFNEAKAALQS